MSKSQNGWTVIPKKEGTRRITLSIVGETRGFNLNPGYAGFVLAHWATKYHRHIEPLNVGQWDEWGWAYRAVKGQTTGFSNHASGTALDLNATLHPLGASGTLKGYALRTVAGKKVKKVDRVNQLLKGQYRSAIRWGGNYSGRKDEMHYEINTSAAKVKTLAIALSKTPIGKDLIKRNPGLKSLFD